MLYEISHISVQSEFSYNIRFWRKLLPIGENVEAW